MEEIILGTIGTGSIVHHILDAVKQTVGISLGAVYSRSEQKGEELAKQYGSEKIYTNLQKMMEDPKINTIYIASPNTLHYEHARESLLHGKHVICEKPFSTKAAHVRELKKIAEERGLYLLDATTTFFLPNFVLLKEHLTDVGRIRLVMCNYSQYSSRYDLLKESDMIPNVFNPSYGGGSLMDINYYNVYLAVALFGKPEKCSYYPNFCHTGVDTSGVLIMQYPDFVFDGVGAKDTWGVNYAQIEGEDGYIYVENGSNGIEKVRIVTRGQELEFNEQTHEMPGETNRYYYEIGKITRLILDGQREEISRNLQIAEHTAEVLEKVRKSIGISFPGD